MTKASPELFGYALGIALCTATLVGIPLSFWRSESDWLIFGVCLLVGAALGALLWRQVERKARANPKVTLKP